jgi:hypothetical protein
MAKVSKASLSSIFLVSLTASIFAGLIAYAGMRDVSRAFIAAVIAFGVFFLGALLLTVFSKADEDVKPGKPRLS